MKNELSIMDAFRALSEMDEDIEINVRKSPALTEGKSFDVSDPHAMEAAKSFNEAEDTEEPELEVIDADADSVDHLKNKAEYVGQMLLQCKSCKATRFIDADKLQASENDEDVYNLDDECPHCHNSGNGYNLLGQVGKVADEAEDEPKFENDAEKEEASLDNDGVEEAQPADQNLAAPAEPAGPEVSGEDAPVSLDNSDGAYDETNAPDDTADMESGKLGDEINDNEFPWDDTEEKPEEESAKDPLADLLAPKEDKKEESLEEELPEEPVEEDLLAAEDEDNLPMEFIPGDESEEDSGEEQPEEISEPEVDPEDEPEPITVKNFFDQYVVGNDNDDVEYEVEVHDGDEVETYELEEVPSDVNNRPIDKLGTTGKELNIVITDDGELSVEELLSVIDDNDGELKIRVSDDEDLDESLSVEEVLKQFGDRFIARIERPLVTVLFLANDEEQVDADAELADNVEPEADDVEETEPSLAEQIYKNNKMFSQKAFKQGTDEYWIRESLKDGEDLGYIFEHFILPTNNESLVRRFKFETGYRDIVDNALLEAYNKVEDYSDWREYDLNKLHESEQCSEDTHAKEAKPMPDLEADHAKAKELADKEGKPVIYGYCSRGRNFSVDPIVCDDLRKCTDEFMKKYHSSASVHVAYPEQTEACPGTDCVEKVCPKCGKEICECDQTVKEEFAVKGDDGFEFASVNLSKEDALTIAKEHEDETGAETVVTDDDGRVIKEASESGWTDSQLEKLARDFVAGKHGATYLAFEKFGNPVNSIGVLYRFDNVEDYEHNVGKSPDFEDDLSIETVLELNDREQYREQYRYVGSYKKSSSVKSFKNRNSLALAIKECRNNNKPYSVRRSLNEGYRYDLVISEGTAIENKLDQVQNKLAAVKDQIENAQNAMKEELPDVEFNEEEFDKNINEYFDQEYDECVRYRTESGSIDEHGEIIVEGYVTYGEDAEETPISFTLTPSNRLVEGLQKTIYTVTNSLSDETFECEME